MGRPGMREASQADSLRVCLPGSLPCLPPPHTPGTYPYTYTALTIDISSWLYIFLGPCPFP